MNWIKDGCDPNTLAELSSKAYSTWVNAKTNNGDFALARQSVVNQTLDQFDSGTSKERMDEIFGEVGYFLRTAFLLLPKGYSRL
jgi:hypothetical protein